MNISAEEAIITKSLAGVVLVSLEVHMWSGSKRLKKAALIQKNPEFANLPPEQLATLGGTKICNPKELAPNLNRKREAARLLSEHGLPFMKGWGIPQHKWDFVYKELMRIKVEFEASSDELYKRFDTAINNWRCDPVNKDWAHLIHDIPTAEYVAGKMSFKFHSVRALSPSADENHESNAGYREQMTGLKGELFDDAAKEADTLITKYLTGVDNSGVVRRREKITWRTLGPLRRIADKFESFAFLDPTVEPLSDVIEHVLGLLPPEGPIEGVNLMHIWTLAQMLSSPVKAIQIARIATEAPTPADAFSHLLNFSVADKPKVVEQVATPVFVESREESAEEVEPQHTESGMINVEVEKPNFIALF